MSASPQDVQQQLQAFGGQQPTWQQLQALAVPPPLPQADDATIDNLEAQAPTPPNLSAGTPPLSPDQQQSVTQDLIGRRDKADKAQTELQAQYEQLKGDLGDEKAALARLGGEETAALEEQPPAPPQQNANPLQRLAPLLFLTAFGGKATKMDANAMLGASMGTVQGYLQGNQQAYEKAVTQYDEAYKRFQDRQKQQMQIFDNLREAYKDRADADLKALQMARTLTEDDGGAKIDQQLLEIQGHYQQAAQTLAQHNYEMQRQKYDDRVKLELARKKEAAAGTKASQEQLTPRAKELAAWLAANGVNLPTGTRSAAARSQTLNGLVEKYGDRSIDQIGQQIRSGQIDMKVATTEATQVARREGNIEASSTALTEPGGLYDQLLETAKKVNLGNSKTKNDIRLGLQKHVYANKDIQDYVTTLEDTRADLTNVLARTGQATETVRAQAHNMFPDDMSFEEAQTAVNRSRKVTAAVMAGNQTVIEALKSGRSVADVADSLDRQIKPPKAAVSSATLSSYAKKHNLSEDAARAFLKSQGYEVQ